MARIKRKFRNLQEFDVVVDIVDDWLPTVATAASLRGVYAKFLELVDLDAGTDDENVLKRGLARDLGPSVEPELMPSDGSGSRVYARVLAADRNTIYLNQALAFASHDVADDAAARKYICGKILHELIHWIELHHPGLSGEDDKSMFNRSAEYGRKMENAFHDLPENAVGPEMPAALAAAFLKRETAQPPSHSMVISGALDGRNSLGSALTAESAAAEVEMLAFEHARDEPVLDLTPSRLDADSSADRLNTPDFSHLGGLRFDGRIFKLDHDSLELFCRINDIVPATGEKILFGLRGCDLHLEDEEPSLPFAAEGLVSEARFDHSVRRCVLGVWDRDQRAVALYPGSTVPNKTNMLKQVGKCDGGVVRVEACNRLPTGHYRYKCGTHKSVWGAFLMDQKVVVLRSCTDADYTLEDHWHACWPADNIHPAFRTSDPGFSSAGCQTVAGNFKNDKHLGDWALFRQSAGLSNNKRADVGRAFSYLLVTAREMRLVRFLLDRSGGMPGDSDLDALAAHYGCLRFGSSGERVERLQRAIGAGVDGDFGAATASLLIKAQRRQGLSPDGLCNAKVAQSLGFSMNVAGSGPVPPNPILRDMPRPIPSLGMDLPVRRGEANNANVRRVQELLNRLGYMRIVDGDYGRSTAEAVVWARDAFGLSGDGDSVDKALAEKLVLLPPLNADLSTEGATFIGMTEIGSPPYYERVVKFPHFPGEMSGVTIGFGYDLRFVTAERFESDWAPHLPDTMIAALRPHCGKPGSANAVRKLKDDHGVVVPFAAGSRVFFDITLPEKLAETRAIYPELDQLATLCRAALVSLVNNRGNSLEPGDRRREMLQIRDALPIPARHNEIPELFRSMKRLWPNSEGLRKRRDDEAELFRRGLRGEVGY